MMVGYCSSSGSTSSSTMYYDDFMVWWRSNEEFRYKHYDVCNNNMSVLTLTLSLHPY